MTALSRPSFVKLRPFVIGNKNSVDSLMGSTLHLLDNGETGSDLYIF